MHPNESLEDLADFEHSELVETIKWVAYSVVAYVIVGVGLLGNLASLLDIHPRELTDWFHVAFIDAYDWVVETNVLGMGTFAVGESMMTKPYISGTPYIQKMGDHCKACSFHPKKNCPISSLYWAYLERHGEAFESNVRMAMPLRTLAKRSAEQKKADTETFKQVLSTLQRGEMLTPD